MVFMRRFQSKGSFSLWGPLVSFNETERSVRFFPFSLAHYHHWRPPFNMIFNSIFTELANGFCAYVRAHRFRSLFLLLYAYHAWAPGLERQDPESATIDSVWTRFPSRNMLQVFTTSIEHT